ncbi:MAG: tetratricopeptide repeat protein [bacterium]
MTDGRATLLAAAESSRLVIFVGAGASIGPPTNLPSWRDANRIVIEALASTAQSVVGDHATHAAKLIVARHTQEKLPPEYQAQILAEFLYERYFEVLKYIDSDRPNATHLAIAWLARLGRVRAVITTNFDRALESAFAAVDVPLDRHFQPEHFRALAGDLKRLDRRKGACQLLKLHGSVDDPHTLIDTLVQRKKGFAPPVLTCVQHLLQSSHWLFLGFSGLDLEAEPNYLALNQESERAIGFTWFVRQGAEPRPAVVKLKNRYGDRGQIVHGELPDWLLDFVSAVSPKPRAWIDDYARRTTRAAAVSPTSALEQGAATWARNLGPDICAVSVAFVAAACAEPTTAAAVVEALLTQLDEKGAKTAVPTADQLYMKALAANGLGILLAGLGRHEDAVQWYTVALDMAREIGDPDTRDRCRGNLAASLETLGRVDEARDMYESALAGYRTRGDPAMLAFGLTALASYFIRQRRLDEARAHAEEAIKYAIEAGDERFRGTALSDLGMIAKLRHDYPRALEIFAEVETLFARLGNDDGVAATVGNRSEVLAALGQFDEAERMQLAALAVNERIQRRDNEAATCLSLGELNELRGDAGVAEQWLMRALDAFRSIKDPSNEAFTLFRLSRLKESAGQFDEALELAESALPLVAQRNRAVTFELWNKIGAISLKVGQIERGEHAFRQVIALAHPPGDPKTVAIASQNIGTALLVQQRGDEAVDAFEQAAQNWQLLGDETNLEYCRYCVSTIRLHEQVLVYSGTARTADTPEEQLAAARTADRIYPDLIERYRSIGAVEMCAQFCIAAGSTAQFLGDDDRAVALFRRAATVFQQLGHRRKAGDAMERAEDILKSCMNSLLRDGRMNEAIPILLQLAEVAEQLGDQEVCATANYNAAICLAATTRDYAGIRHLATRAAELFPPGSDDAAVALRLVAHADAEAEAEKAAGA